MHKTLFRLVAAVALGLVAVVHAQIYPNRAIRLVRPFPPGEVVARLNAEIVRIIHLPDVRELLSAQGAEVIGSTPEEFAAYVRSEIEKWKRVIKDAGVRPE